MIKRKRSARGNLEHWCIYQDGRLIGYIRRHGGWLAWKHDADYTSEAIQFSTMAAAVDYLSGRIH